MPSYKSNLVGLRIAEQSGLQGALPGTPIWEPQQPNSFGDFGGEVKNERRSFINPGRQSAKGAVVDLDASASFTTDFTTRSLLSTIKGFMCANWRKKAELAPTAVAAPSYTVAANGTNFPANSLLFAEGYTTPSNNGIKLVTASTGTSVSCAGLAVEATATGTITKVGVQGAAGDITVTVAGQVATIGATTLNLTTLGIIPGEWFYVGGDLAAERFGTAAANGFYRAKTITATAIVCDRIPTGAATDAGAAKTIRIYTGNALKNESDPTLQVFQLYQAERLYANDTIEYVIDCLANKLTIETKTSSKLTAELELIGLDHVTAVAPKAGTRPAFKPQTAYSASTDYSRLRLLDDAAGTDLAAYLTDIKIELDNGVEADKAIGYIGGVDHSVGDFMVTGSVEAYFSTLSAVAAVRANSTVSLDFATVANVLTPGVGNQAVGWLFDLPALDLGDGRLKVEKDKKVKLPLNLSASAHATYDHTMLLVFFPYLPQVAL